MLFFLCSCSLLRRRRDLLSDLQTGSERGRAFTNSTISAQFRDQIDFPLQPQPRLRTALRLGNIGREARSCRPARHSDWPSPHRRRASTRGFQRARRANGSCSGRCSTSTGRHTTQGSAEFNQGCLPTCQKTEKQKSTEDYVITTDVIVDMVGIGLSTSGRRRL